MRYIVIFILTFLNCTLFGYGQKISKDTPFDKCMKSVIEARDNKIYQAIDSCNKALKLAINPEDFMQYYYQKGVLLEYTNDTINSTKYIDSSFNLSTKANSFEFKTKTLNEQSEILRKKATLINQNYTLNQRYRDLKVLKLICKARYIYYLALKDSLKLKEEIGDSIYNYMIGTIFNNLSESYITLSNLPHDSFNININMVLDSALLLARKGEKYILNSNKKSSIGYSYRCEGKIYYVKGDKNSAKFAKISYFKLDSLLKNNKEIDSLPKSVYYFALAEYHANEGDFDSAKTYLNRGLNASVYLQSTATMKSFAEVNEIIQKKLKAQNDKLINFDIALYCLLGVLVIVIFALIIKWKALKKSNKDLTYSKNELAKSYKRLNLLSDLGQEITTELACESLEHLIDKIHENVKKIIVAEVFGIGIFDEDNQELSLTVIENGEKLNPTYSTIENIEQKDYFRPAVVCLRDEVPWKTSNFEEYLKEHPEIIEPRAGNNPKSIIYLPLIVNENSSNSNEEKHKIIGVITVQSFEKNAYEDFDNSTLGILAKYVAIALDNVSAYQTKDKLLSILSHDLRGPIQENEKFISKILRNKENLTHAELVDYLKLIQKYYFSTLNLATNLYQWSKFHTGKIIYSPFTFDLKEVIDNNIDLHKLSAENNNIEMINNVISSKLIFADKIMIDSIVRNLISNAVKNAQNGKIEIAVNDNGVYYEFEILDTGKGLSEKEIEKIKKSDKKYNGLGLKICIEFLKKHQSELIFDKPKTGTGCIVKFNIKKEK